MGQININVSGLDGQQNRTVQVATFVGLATDTFVPFTCSPEGYLFVSGLTAGGESLGEELINNGSFTTNPTEWTLSNWNYDAGADNVDAPDFGGIPSDLYHKTVVFQTGSDYRLQTRVVAIGANPLFVRLNATNIGSFTSTGAKEFDFTPSSNGSLVYHLNANDSATIDDVSVKRIL